MKGQAAILLALLASFALVAGAQTAPERQRRAIQTEGTVLDAPADSRAPASLKLPVRGLSKDRVVLRYGEPHQRHAPVGEPPITRWDYPEFSVFFEYDLVLHAVVPGQLPPLNHRNELAAGG